MFYANYTFEVDFAEEEGNRNYYKKAIEENYEKEEVIEQHKKELDENIIKRYSTVLSMAKYVGKGWFAMQIADYIDYNIVIPDYLLKAVAFAGGETITKAIVWKILKYVISCQSEDKYKEVKKKVQGANSIDEQENIVKEFCTEFSSSMFAKLLICMEENGDR